MLHALRRLLRTPRFSAAVVAMLALGLGASTVVFSILHAVLLRPFGYPDAGRLVSIWAAPPDRAGERVEVSLLRFRLMQQQTASPLSHLAALAPVNWAVTGASRPEHVAGMKVSGPLFAALGLAPRLGRLFTDDEDRPGAEPVALLGHAYWQRAHGGSDGVLGRFVNLDGQPHRIIGVLPPELAFPYDHVAVWTPRAHETTTLSPEQLARGASHLRLVGRLGDGATPAQAQAWLDAVASAYAREHPGNMDEKYRLHAVPLFADLVAAPRPLLWQLFTAVACVLLIACANVANLFLARAIDARRAIAVRSALGASRAQILRDYLLEGLLLAGAGAALGLLFAAWALPAVVALVGEQLPRAGGIALHRPVLGFAFCLATLCGVVLGLVPWFQVSRADAERALRDGGHGTTGRTAGWFRSALVGTEVALALALLAGALLLMRSFQRLQEVPLGFEPAGLHVATLRLPPARYDAAAGLRLAERLQERLQAEPGLTVAVGYGVPFTPDYDQFTYTPVDQPVSTTAGRQLARYGVARPGLFGLLGARLVAGRDFTDDDRAGTARVAIINEAMARRLFPDGLAVGREFFRVFDRSRWQVVGVTADMRAERLDGDVQPAAFFPITQSAAPSFTFVVRAAGDPGLAASAFRAALRAIDPELPVLHEGSMASLVGRTLATRRLILALLGGFAACALFLAAAGIASVVAWQVSQRRREIGIRLALGAEARRLVGFLVLGALPAVGAGLAAGLGLVVLGAGVVELPLFATSARDPLLLALALGLLAASALLACWLPARRAARVNPIEVLRSA